MFGIIPIYFAGRNFYNLAQEHNRSAWGYAILGIGVYFGSQLLLGFILGIVLTIMEVPLDTSDEMLINLGGIVIAIFSTWLLYRILKNSWEKKGPLQQKSDLLDDF